MQLHATVSRSSPFVRRGRRSPTARPGRAGTTLLAAAVYLVAAVVLWWHLWTGDPSATTTCGCGDAARFLWYFEWPVFAIGHGHSLLYSQWLFHPTGVNLLDDTSVLALGVLLGPVTAVFGPVAGMNVALTLAPALSALAAFALLRRWVAWQPAAIVGGALYGFSPFVVTELALNQLNIAFLAVPPLVVLVLDELLLRQRRSPVRSGVLLGLLVVAQFFVGTEVLLITVLFAGLGVLVLVVWSSLRRREELRRRARHAAVGLSVAVGVSAVVLAYPLWFLLRGPAHLSGPIWSNGTALSEYGTTFWSFWRAGGLGQVRDLSLRFGGYQGPVLPGLGYLGTGVVVVAVVGTVVWRRDRRLLFFGALGLVAAALSLAPGHGYWVPWSLFDRLPWIGNVVEARFTVVVSLCAAVMVALVVDHAVTAAAARWPARPARRLVGGLLVAAVLVPSLVVLWPNVPLTTRPVALPPWFADVGARLPPGNVVLVYPAPFSGLQSSEAWQAVNRMRWAQAGGGGPTGQADRAGRARPGVEVLSAASLALGSPPTPTPGHLEAVRRALGDWGVTLVVVPDQSQLAPYERGRSTADAVGLLTAAIGAPPRYSHGAWVWTRPPGTAAARSSGTAGGREPAGVDEAAFERCTQQGSGPSGASQVAACVLHAGDQGH